MTVQKKIRVKPGPLMYPLPVVMVTAGDAAHGNIITVAWTGIVNTDPPMLSVSIRKTRFSHHLISERGAFVVNLVNEELTKAMDFCGVRSGEKLDKFAETGLTTVPAEEVEAPMIREAPVNLECRVTEVKELPSHDLFLAEIVAVHIDAKMVDEKGLYDFAAMDLVAFNHGAYYRAGRKELGRFGYSVMRRKTLKKKRRQEAEARAGKKAAKAGKKSGQKEKREKRKEEKEKGQRRAKRFR